MTPLVASLLLFVAVAVGFIFVHLVAGKLIRPNKPGAEKQTIYECGEPTIGSAWIQFDLRFYVVALLFVIFDVEVAFFFPWAEVFGKANNISAIGKPQDAEQYQQIGKQAAELLSPSDHPTLQATEIQQLQNMTPDDVNKLRELKSKSPKELTADERAELMRLTPLAKTANDIHTEARSLSWLALGEIVVFFGVLLVGFAYLWQRGDLAWVRSLRAEESAAAPEPAPPAPRPTENVLVGAGSAAQH